MFYSETLLSKTGPLARVWLSANLERKLSKTHILQSNIETSVNAIVDQGTAPMALRLSGQLLLGVVRIYSRKARYLLDDCNEALLKIKMAFRPGNVDLPANFSMPSAAALTIEDRISDPMMPDLDPSLLDFRPMQIDFGSAKDDPLNWNSQLPSDPISIEIGRNAPPTNPAVEFDEEDMHVELDLGLDMDDDMNNAYGLNKDASTAMPGIFDDAQDSFGDLGGLTQAPYDDTLPPLIPDVAQDAPLGDVEALDEEGLENLGDADDVAVGAFTDPRLHRDSQSPLSSMRNSMERDSEFVQAPNEEEMSTQQAPLRTKKRKVLHADADTMLSSHQIKQQQTDRSNILRPAHVAARDPALVDLMNMHKSGGIASEIMGHGAATLWAPELRDILSIEMARQSGERKRKRDSGVADVSENETSADVLKIPQLEIPEDETFGAVDQSFGLADNTMEIITGANVDNGYDYATGNLSAEQDEASLHADHARAHDAFDDTVAPLLHPSEQGAISQGTRHAVHLLRDRFGTTGKGHTSQQKNTQILFQDMLPERSTKRADATKMFFEVLVLATKDAVKVDQTGSEIGSAIRVRAKRGLWGQWAELDAGGEIAGQSGTAAPISIPA